MLQITPWEAWTGIPAVKGSGGAPNFGSVQSRVGRIRWVEEVDEYGGFVRNVSVEGRCTMRFENPVNRGTGYYRLPLPAEASCLVDPWEPIGVVTIGFEDLDHRTGNLHVNGSPAPYGPDAEQALVVVNGTLFLDQNLKSGVDIGNFHMHFSYEVA